MANAKTIPRVYVPVVGALLKYFASEKSDGRLSQYKIGELRKYGCNPGVARPGLDWLVANALLEDTIETHEDDRWRVWQLTSEGAQFADTLFDASGDRRPESEKIDDVWKPLDLEREAREETLGAVEDLYERVRGDNEFAERQPDAHQGIAESLKIGLSLLRSGTFIKRQIYSLVVLPSIWLANTFVRAALGDLARRVIDLLYWVM